MIRVATDVGGTFTDFVAFDEGSGALAAAKASTSLDIIAGIVECFRKSGTEVATVGHFVHGSTVAINTVIEHKGARTGLLATEGFRHLLELGRGNIPNSFDLMFETPRPLVPPQLRRAVRERMLSDGSVLTALDQDQALAAIRELAGNGLESIAICLLHSYANPAHEQALKKLAAENYPKLYVTASSDIIRQYREYERTSTTVLNAYVGPKVGAYLRELDGFLRREAFRGTSMIMQSNGGTMTIETAHAQPVRMMESGPVGGTMAAAYLGKQLGCDNVVAFDMGGTTAKVSMVKKGEIEVADGYFIGGQVQAMFGVSTVMPHIRTGKLRALATTSLKRFSLLPQVPTIAESGFPGFEATAWYGLLAPSGTPKTAVTRLHDETARALGTPHVKEKLVPLGFDIIGSTPEAFAAYIKAEIKKWGEIVRAVGIKVE